MTGNNKMSFDIYYVAGQSNAGGASMPEDLSGENLKYKDFSDSFIWWNQDYTSQVFDLESLKIGVNSKPGYSSVGYFGFDHSMLWHLARYKNNNICVVKLGIGGTGLDNSYTPTWNSIRVGSLYDGLINSKVTCQAYLESLGYTVNHKALIWVQGEADSMSATPTANYEANQTALFNKLRTDIKVDLPIVDLRISSNVGPAYANWAAINTAKDNVALALSDIYQLDFSDLPFRPDVDFVHYSADSYAIGGERIFQVIKDF